MNRFKFRVWDKQEKIMFENVGAWGDSFYIQGADLDGEYFETIPTELIGIADGDIIEIETSDRFIIEQCTGRKDKNGKLVYEGDIVLWEGAKTFIRFVDGQWGLFCNQETSWQLDVRNIRFNRVLEKCEIIGNIHEVNHE